MNTLTLSDLPQELIEGYRRLAEANDQPVEDYVAELIIGSNSPSDKRELVEILQRTLDAHPTPGISNETVEQARREVRGE